MKTISMDAQGHVEMAYGAFNDWTDGGPVKEISEAEELFLKDLYNYMKKRDSPIERIPNLGFKQIDLFLMFNTVRDLGGYQSVTAQQLWKQVYNTLGGNPRSTSAATCTRRHYERLLLAYEYHLKGMTSPSLLPHHQYTHWRSADYGRYGDEGPLPPKRKIISVSLPQNPHAFHRDQLESTFRMPRHYPPHHASRVVQPPQPTFEPYSPAPPAQEPLDNLRYLAECYKNASGLTEPLNLSMKWPRRDPDSKPASSFSPPPSSKNPKFLNKPSPLYTPRCTQVVNGGRREVQNGEPASGDSSRAFPTRGQEVYADAAASGGAACTAARAQTDGGADLPAPEPCSPKADFVLKVKQNKRKSPDVSDLGPSRLRPGLPKRNEEGEVEIEMPLSAFYGWLKLCGSSAAEPERKPEEPSKQRRCSGAEDCPSRPTASLNLQNVAQVSEDLRLRQRTIMHPGYRHPHTSQAPLAASLHLPPDQGLTNAHYQDLLIEDTVSMSHSSRRPNGWGPYDSVTSGPAVHGEGRAPTSGPSPVLLLDSRSMPVLQLSSEEVMKLKRIISSSL